VTERYHVPSEAKVEINFNMELLYFGHRRDSKNQQLSRKISSKFLLFACSTSPTIWKLVNSLKQEQSLVELEVEQYIAGRLPETGRIKCSYAESCSSLNGTVKLNF
jgi:hypothetical protein